MNKFNRNFKRTISSLMLFMLILALIPLNVLAEERVETDIEKAIDNAVNWLIEKDEVDQWAVMDLARANKEIPESYLNEFRNNIQDNKGEFKSVTDYGKYSIVASSLGLNAADLFGYNFIERIYSHENIFAQGNFGGIFGLLAFDSKNYDIPDEAKWTRENIIKELLEGQNQDGGFAWAKDNPSDIDTTAMVLQALSNYQYREDVKAATGRALDYLSKNQEKDGGYIGEYTGDSSESVSQVILALASLEIDLAKDERFIKDNNLIEKLMSFNAKDGGFIHNIGEESSAYSTEQALRALVGYNRFLNKDFKFFHMKDAKLIEFPEEIKSNINFSDIDKASNWAKDSIIKAGNLGLISGRGDNKFAPKDNITRGEFAKLLVNLLELETSNEGKEVFIDVKTTDWYYEDIMKAYGAGIIKGSGNKFLPGNTITREEMAVMIYRALSLAKEVETQGIKDINEVSNWAIDGVNLVYELGIMTGDKGKFNPKGNVTREMAATIIVRISELD